MEPNLEQRQDLIRQTWGDYVEYLRFLTDREAELTNRERAALLTTLGDRVSRAARGSKLHTGPLSPGCQACAQGEWSCLFLTRKCQASCFTCPAFKDSGEQPPFADGLDFPDLDEYLSYLDCLDIRGVSFSGGDPLLEPQTLKDSIQRIRRRFGPSMYIWVYTNGLCATRELLEDLTRAGLDEIRFNIGAVGYSLDQVALALGVVPTVTVEVACVPEDVASLERSMVEMARMGVDHVNLHQIILSRANFASLVGRDYHFTRSASPSVVESEIALLRLMARCLDLSLNLPVNHCNTAYKSRWQTRGTLRRVNRRILAPWETETEFGYIRSLWIDAGPTDLDPLTLQEPQPDSSQETAHRDPDSARLYLHPGRLSLVEDKGYPVHLQYCAASLTREADPRWKRRELGAGGAGGLPGVVLLPVSPVIVLDRFSTALLQKIASAEGPADATVELPDELAAYERIPPGLPVYD